MRTRPLFTCARMRYPSHLISYKKRASSNTSLVSVHSMGCTCSGIGPLRPFFSSLAIAALSEEVVGIYRPGIKKLYLLSGSGGNLSRDDFLQLHRQRA